jgi:hypothetical protein
LKPDKVCWRCFHGRHFLCEIAVAQTLIPEETAFLAAGCAGFEIRVALTQDLVRFLCVLGGGVQGGPHSYTLRERDLTIDWRRLDGARFSNSPREISWTGYSAESHVREYGSDAESTLAAAHLVGFDKPLEILVMPGCLSARVSLFYDGCSTLVFGLLRRRIYGTQEIVNCTRDSRVAKSIALFMVRWRGVSPHGK